MNLPRPRIGIITTSHSQVDFFEACLSKVDSFQCLDVYSDIVSWKLKAHQEPYVLFANLEDISHDDVDLSQVKIDDHCALLNIIDLKGSVESLSYQCSIFESIHELESITTCMLIKLSFKAVLEKYKYQQASYRHTNFFQNSPVGMYRLNMKGELVHLNSKMAQICGYSNTESFQNTFEYDINQLFVDPSLHKSFFEEIASGHTDIYFESQIDRADGATAWISIKGALTVDDVSGRSGIDFVVTDITGAKEVEEQVYYDSIHDTLTGLYNRLYIVEKLDEFIKERQLHQSPFGVLMFDLDHFQKVNDIFGHKEGDRLILQLTKRLRKVYHSRATLARLGGDEFIIVFHQEMTEADLILEGDRLLILFEEPFKVSGSDYRIKCSIGLKFCDSIDLRGDTIMRDVDTAVYRAKMNGRSRWVLFHNDFIEEIKHRLILEKELRVAIEEDQFTVFYQPIIDAKTGKIDGFEALVRWFHPEKGMISPVEFIPVAEESNLILPLGEYVLRTVVKQIKSWHNKGYCHLIGAVNTSARQFQMTNIGKLVHEVLSESDLSPKALKIEVTESLAMNNVDYTISTFQDLDQSGIRISIDDFGTGYSSLSYLKKFPFHTLKIDRSFVNEIQVKGDDAEITRAIILMAQSLGLEIVAEGVETKEQLDFLEALGCDYYQGYFFSKPLPEQEFERLLERNLA